MSENIKFSKQVYNKDQYTKVIDTSFKQLGVQSIQEKINKQPTKYKLLSPFNTDKRNILTISHLIFGVPIFDRLIRSKFMLYL
jgi:hypothetical protein